MKIEIENGYDGFERHVTGNIDLDGNNMYEWELETYDGFTSIYLIDCEVRINLEDEDELHLFNIDEDIIFSKVSLKNFLMEKYLKSPSWIFNNILNIYDNFLVI